MKSAVPIFGDALWNFSYVPRSLPNMSFSQMAHIPAEERRDVFAISLA